jgi:hypothetical protein
MINPLLHPLRSRKALVMVSAGAFAVLAAFVAASAAAQSDKAPVFDFASVKQHVIPFGFIRGPWGPNIDWGPKHRPEKSSTAQKAKSRKGGCMSALQ